MIKTASGIDWSTPARFLHFKGQIWVIEKYQDGLWRDKWGTVYAVAEDTASVDNIDRCGIGWFSLPEKHPLTDACRPHDFMYSSPAFQMFHTREEADRALWWYCKILGFPTTGKIFRWISDKLGGSKWENSETR